MKTRKISILIAIGMSIFFASPAITSFATGINQSVNQTINKTGTVDFNELSYTDVMSEGTWYSNIVGSLNNGTNINVIGENSNWYEIDYNGGTAWIPKSRVSFSQIENINITGVVDFNGLTYTDVMSEGTWYSSIAGALNNGTNVNIVGETSNWYEIEYNNGTAWIPKSRINTLNTKTIGSGIIDFNELSYTDVMSQGTWYSDIIGSLNNGTEVNIVGQNSNWYELVYNNQNVWVPKSRVNTVVGENETETVDFSGLSYTDIMNGPTWDTSVAGTLSDGTSVQVIGQANGWDEIQYNGNTAWIPEMRVTTPSNWSAQQNENMQQKIQDIISYGEQFIGTPYVWGGESPSGFDCSGLMQYIFANYGVNLPRTTSAQQECGTPVAQGNLQPGDLVFWGEPAYHVALYIGNGQILVAPHTGTTVTIMNLYPYTNARRIL
ncbi:MAG: NlpC/P60 family protein [Clostridium sp.]